MLQVTITIGNYSITVSSKNMIEPGSVDLTKGNWPEMAWNPDEVKEALASLAAQPYNPKRVNCQQGQNRSPTLAILYLWWQSGQTLAQVYNAVVAAYRDAGALLGETKIKNLLEQLLAGYTGSRSSRQAKFVDVWGLRAAGLVGLLLPRDEDI